MPAAYTAMMTDAGVSAGALAGRSRSMPASACAANHSTANVAALASTIAAIAAGGAANARQAMPSRTRSPRSSASAA